MALSPGDTLGPYEILTLVGKGGMGEVYRAHDSRLNRDVAIKVSRALGSVLYSADTRDWTPIMSTQGFAAAIYDDSGSSGRQLIGDLAGGLRAAPFDPGAPAPTNAATSVLKDVYFDVENEPVSWIDVSRTGTAVYVPANPTRSSLVWAGRDGAVESTGAPQDLYREVSLSPDGLRALVRHGHDLWVHDLQRATRSRLVTANATSSNLFAALLDLDGSDELPGQACAISDSMEQSLPDDLMRAQFRASEIVSRLRGRWSAR